jgi:hypothetical protein
MKPNILQTGFLVKISTVMLISEGNQCMQRVAPYSTPNPGDRGSNPSWPASNFNRLQPWRCRPFFLLPTHYVPEWIFPTLRQQEHQGCPWRSKLNHPAMIRIESRRRCSCQTTSNIKPGYLAPALRASWTMIEKLQNRGRLNPSGVAAVIALPAL